MAPLVHWIFFFFFSSLEAERAGEFVTPLNPDGKFRSVPVLLVDLAEKHVRSKMKAKRDETEIELIEVEIAKKLDRFGQIFAEVRNRSLPNIRDKLLNEIKADRMWLFR